MSAKHKKRLNAVTSARVSLLDKSSTISEGKISKMKSLQPMATTNNPEMNNGSFFSILNVVLGLAAMVSISYVNVTYTYQIHENTLWFTNIKEVEREISFRTESGLYYSYYKQLVDSPSLWQGIRDLTEDKLTEHPDTVNILARMNIYQEVILAFIYRNINFQMEPIMFYINFVFYLQGLLIVGIYLLTWFLSNSWLAGLLASIFYIFNKNDTNRVSSAIPLRECFSLPFLWVQAAALTIYFKPAVSRWLERLSLTAVAFSTFFFCLFWQFNQFIMMLQAFALFGVWVLGLIPASKIKKVMLCQLCSLLLVCLLQFGNKMILGSLAVSFILVSLTLLTVFKSPSESGSVFFNLLRVVGLSFISLSLMFLLSSVLKVLFQIDADEHIFTFLSDKFTQRDTKNFDSRIYLCLQIFGFITYDVFERLTENFVLPLYVPTHLILLLILVYTVLHRWRSQVKDNKQTDNKENVSEYYFEKHPDIAFHIVLAVFFGALAIITLRMKYFWTPYVCVFAALGVGNEDLWSFVLRLTKASNKHMGVSQVTLVRSALLVLTIAVVTGKLLPGVMKELEGKYEFWDPDTVELMEWIVKNTKPTDSFTGSMQLLAGVKLCTLRPITNHPHYEDKYLRQKTKQLYQIYGKQPPEHVHNILKKYNSNYIILEDSICRAPSREGCRTPDIVDIDNGVMPDDYFKIPDLIVSKTPRFCEMVRHQTQEYAKFFKAVFQNKTFRIYKVL
ncbi:C-mannosyltransferase DPY19L3 isoform X1 [Biomphalaria glabrata]|nr:C-mannosyltransferase DPY19L3 isoform X1 [Biomphalaria glabrata]